MIEVRPTAWLLVAGLAQGCTGDRGIERPQPLSSASAVEYPLELWDQDVEGSTLVRVLVNTAGGVDSVMVLESSGHAALDSAALQGAKSMEFEPARRAGEPLRVWARVPVHFSKSGEPPRQPPSAAAPDTTSEPGAGPAAGASREPQPEPTVSRP